MELFWRYLSGTGHPRSPLFKKPKKKGGRGADSEGEARGDDGEEDEEEEDEEEEGEEKIGITLLRINRHLHQSP